MDSGKNEERRTYYRLKYPAAERPVFVWGARQCEVTELSENGARILWPPSVPLPAPEAFSGAIRFKDGQSSQVTGEVLRSSQDEVILKITGGITFQRMMSEQIRLRQKGFK